MKKLLRDVSPKWRSVIFWTLLGIFSIEALWGQLEVGDTSPDFTAPVCVNDNTEDGDWSLYDEGANKVTWINLFTSW